MGEEERRGKSESLAEGGNVVSHWPPQSHWKAGRAELRGFRAVRKGSARENGDAKIVVVDSYLRTEPAAVNNGAGEGGEMRAGCHHVKSRHGFGRPPCPPRP